MLIRPEKLNGSNWIIVTDWFLGPDELIGPDGRVGPNRLKIPGGLIGPNSSIELKGVKGSLDPMGSVGQIESLDLTCS